MDNGNCIFSHWVSVYETLCHEFAAGINVIYLLGCDVLALLHFENVLLSVDDFERTVWKDYSDIACVVPSIFINNFGSVYWIIEIFTKYNRSSETNLSFWLLIVCQIIHLRNINEFKLCAVVWSTYMTIISLSFAYHKRCSCCLSLTVSLSYISLENLGEKRKDSRRNWSWACYYPF